MRIQSFPSFDRALLTFSMLLNAGDRVEYFHCGGVHFVAHYGSNSN